MNLSDFDYSLPRRFIAQYPPQKRGNSKLLVLDRETGKIEHRVFSDIVNYFNNDDILCINNTKVFPARIFGRKEKTGGKVEVFLLRKIEDGIWEALLRPARRLRKDLTVIFTNDIKCRIEERCKNGKWRIKFLPEGVTTDEIFSLGDMPIPPYIKRLPEEIDRFRYQTIYAEKEGSVASPTAGLHFTEEILNLLENKGVKILRILLHIGLGTFKPVKTEDITKHLMESEYYEIGESSERALNRARKTGGSIFAVGTTTTRALESTAMNGLVKAKKEWTDKFIYPPYKFQVVDHLITNFHLPKTTLLMLVSAFATREMILEAYEEAKKRDYRFFSYGDAMLIL